MRSRLASLFLPLGLVLVWLLLATTPAGAAERCWTRVVSPTTHTLNAVDQAGADGYVAVGNYGTVALCDAAGNWSTVNAGTAERLKDVDAVFDQVWAVGDAGVIVRSTDGGANWSTQVSGTSEDLYGVDFLTASEGWTVGGDFGDSVLLHTDDGGLNWTPQTPARADGPLTSIAMTGPSTGAALAASGGGGGQIFHTSDGGVTWPTTWYWPSGDANFWWLYDVSAYGSRLWAAADFLSQHAAEPSRDAAFLSTDGGARWRTQWSTKHYGFRCVANGTSTAVWMVGTGVRDGCVARTADGGAHWELQTLGLEPLNGAAFADALNGYAVGARGVIYRTTNGWLDQTRPDTRAPYAASAHHGGTAKLRYRVGDVDSPLCNVTIRIRDAGGTVVKTLRLGYRRAGHLNVASFRCTLPAGSYRFRVNALDAGHNGQLHTGVNTLTVL